MKRCLMIFAKAPMVGRCKTRLCLSDESARRIHEAFVNHVIARYTGDWTQELWSDDISHPFFDDFELVKHQQIGSDLGQRMHNAFEHSLDHFQQVFIIGTDAPSLPIEFIEQGFAALENHDVVIGPSCDGGYYALGLKCAHRELFSPGIHWGGADVFLTTLQRTRMLGLSLKILPFWFDVDRPLDLTLLRLMDTDQLSEELTQLILATGAEED